MTNRRLIFTKMFTFSHLNLFSCISAMQQMCCQLTSNDVALLPEGSRSVCGSLRPPAGHVALQSQQRGAVDLSRWWVWAYSLSLSAYVYVGAHSNSRLMLSLTTIPVSTHFYKHLWYQDTVHTTNGPSSPSSRSSTAKRIQLALCSLSTAYCIYVHAPPPERRVDWWIKTRGVGKLLPHVNSRHILCN